MNRVKRPTVIIGCRMVSYNHTIVKDHRMTVLNLRRLSVYSRTGFLKTLEDTLGFNPKVSMGCRSTQDVERISFLPAMPFVLLQVDFNAGVVAAGEAQIESTVTGNTSTQLVSDKTEALKDQSQVYLPINNALSKVGYVLLCVLAICLCHIACF